VTVGGRVSGGVLADYIVGQNGMLLSQAGVFPEAALMTPFAVPGEDDEAS